MTKRCNNSPEFNINKKLDGRGESFEFFNQSSWELERNFGIFFHRYFWALYKNGFFCKESLNNP